MVVRPDVGEVLGLRDDNSVGLEDEISGLAVGVPILNRRLGVCVGDINGDTVGANVIG